VFEIVDAEEQYQFCGQRSGGYVISIRISIASSEKLKWPHFLNFGGGGTQRHDSLSPVQRQLEPRY
jgi:hypothetical protein